MPYNVWCRTSETPLEKLACLSDEQRTLRSGITLEALQHQAGALSDNESNLKYPFHPAATAGTVNFNDNNPPSGIAF